MAIRTSQAAEPSGVLLEPRREDSESVRSDRPPQQTLTVDVSGAAVAKIVAGLLALGLIAGLMARMRDVFVWTLAATFLAIALNPLVERLEPRLGRRPAATAVFLGIRRSASSPSSLRSWRRS